MPREILGLADSLESRNVSGNGLADLPDWLRVLFCWESPFRHLPQIMALPGTEMVGFESCQLKRASGAAAALAWLALAGNPAAEMPPGTDGPMAEVPWPELKLGPRLGGGASGFMDLARWRPAGQGAAFREVAVKLIKGSMTSDGLPECDMAASLALGSRPHLPGILREISGHPEGRAGLVMALIDPAYQPLAGPPSLNTWARAI